MASALVDANGYTLMEMILGNEVDDVSGYSLLRETTLKFFPAGGAPRILIEGTTIPKARKIMREAVPDDDYHKQTNYLENVLAIPMDRSPPRESQLTFSAETWTGIPSNKTLDAQQQKKLIELLDYARGKVADLDLTNAERSQVIAHVIAARTLADTPEPPADLIWAIIARLNNIAGIASLFLEIGHLIAAN